MSEEGKTQLHNGQQGESSSKSEESMLPSRPKSPTPTILSSCSSSSTSTLRDSIQNLGLEESYVKATKQPTKKPKQKFPPPPRLQPSRTYQGPSEEQKRKSTLRQLKETAERIVELEKEYEEQVIPEGVEKREVYYRRLNEYLASVQKQSGNDKAILDSIRNVKKDINLLEGKLERTYAEVEGTVFKVARRDSSLSPSYKLVVELHSTCAAIVATEAEVCKVKRDTGELRMRIECEKIVAILRRDGKVEEDPPEVEEARQEELKRLKEENNRMRERLRRRKK